MKAARTIKITTLGCKVNQCESDTIGRSLQKIGFMIEKNDQAPDICIVNTCTVTQKASMQSRQAIRKAIKTYPNAKIVVTGCYAQTAPQELADIEGVSVVIGNTDKLNLAALLTQQDFSLKRLPTIIHHNIGRQTHFKTTAVIAHGSRTRPFLKIQDGCNAGCTYCIVPHARGPNRSMPLKTVLTQLDRLNQAGFKEIVLTGIHLGCYGQDFKPPLTFLNLLETIDRTQPAKRVRLSSTEPMELSEEIIELVAVSKVFCHHFHVPLQSGDNTILKKMKRPYLREDYHQKILQIHSKVPEAAIGADIIVGFPGETDAAFNQTLALIASLPVSYLHVFPFSPRKHTPAYSYPNKVPERIIKKRCKILRELGQAKKRRFYTQKIGQIVTILVEGTRDRDSGKLKGLSTNYIPVLIDGNNSLQNTLVEAEITEVTSNLKVMGKIKSSADGIQSPSGI